MHGFLCKLGRHGDCSPHPIVSAIRGGRTKIGSRFYSRTTFSDSRFDMFGFFQSPDHT